MHYNKSSQEQLLLHLLLGSQTTDVSGIYQLFDLAKQPEDCILELNKHQNSLFKWILPFQFHLIS